MLVVVLSACDAIGGRESTIDLAFLALAGQTATIDLPAEIVAGEAFDVEVSTLGSRACVEPARSRVNVEGGVVSVTVRDRTYSGGCPYVLESIPREIAIPGLPAGSVELVFEGRTLGSEGGYVGYFVRRTVEVVER